MTDPRESISRLARRFDEQDRGLIGADPLSFEGYERRLDETRAGTGLEEACRWGWADIDGAACALVVFDFAFLGGSMGVVVGEKIARAFDGARRRKLPVVTATESGGARMQEGMVSLVQMAKTVEARRAHAEAGLIHVSLLGSPTTGGVYASFASLADVVLAEREATVGFAGPRVVAELTGSAPSPRVHTAEFAFEHGLVDAVLAPSDVRSTIARILWASTPKRTGPSGSSVRPIRSGGQHGAPPNPPEPPSAWQRVELARHPDRPKARQVLDVLLQTSFELHGDRTGAPDDGSVVAKIGALTGRRINVVAIAQDASGEGRIRPEGFRKAIRALGLAGRLGLPVVTFIDTRGADPLPSSEGHGIAAAIAGALEAMLACPSPTLAVVTGEGGSGGAFAMAPADRLIAWENAVFSVIAPEGAATILYRDPRRAPDLAARLKVTADDLVELGIVDSIVTEPRGGAHADPAVAAEDLADAVAAEIETLSDLRRGPRLRGRRRRWRAAGNRYLLQARG